MIEQAWLKSTPGELNEKKQNGLFRIEGALLGLPVQG
jgi:hypothetical protein